MLTLFGGGHQALWQLRAVAQVRRLSNVFVITRSAQSAQHFIEEAQAYLDCPLIAGVSAQEAVSQSDMVLTATSSATPVLQREWLRPGTHITAMGSSTPASSELDGPTMSAGRLFVDRAQSTRNESGEFLNACKQGYLSADTELNELGEGWASPVGINAERTRSPARGLFGGSASRVHLASARALPISRDLGRDGILYALAATALHAIAHGEPPELIVGHGVLGRLLARLTCATGAKPPVVWEISQSRMSGADGYAVVHPDDDDRHDYRCVYDVSGNAAGIDKITGFKRPEQNN